MKIFFLVGVILISVFPVGLGLILCNDQVIARA
jgi:hypothetical protein